MQNDIIDVLTKLYNGEYTTTSKPNNDLEKKINEAIYKLTNLYVLKKIGNKYTVSNKEHLFKIIELKSIDKYLEWLELESKKLDDELKKEKELKSLEIKLAKSNLKANKLNKKIAERNKRETVINIILGAINIGLLIWQILKPE